MTVAGLQVGCSLISGVLRTRAMQLMSVEKSDGGSWRRQSHHLFCFGAPNGASNNGRFGAPQRNDVAMTAGPAICSAPLGAHHGLILVTL